MEESDHSSIYVLVQKNQLTPVLGLNYRIPILFHWSKHLFHAVLVTVALQYAPNTETVILLALFFFLRLCWLFGAFYVFNMNFGIALQVL